MLFNRLRFNTPLWRMLGVMGLVLALGLTGCDSQSDITEASDDDDGETRQTVPRTVNLFGDLRFVHDPSIIKAHDQYYLYSTGGGIQWRSSPDMTQWSYQGDVLGGVPQWAEDAIQGVQDLWAPSISYFNGRFHLYYSASTFGSGRSAIGLATNPVLSPDSAGYAWADQGKVIESFEPDSYNAIDPNIIIDTEDRVWMSFGSWNETGIRMRRIDPSTGMPSAEDETLYELANRPNANENAIEAPYIIRHGNYYYLFVSFDHCCDGVNSTYNIRVGRSESVTGPYVDSDGTPMTQGGGTLILEEYPNWKGPGHNSVLQDGDETYLVYHAYSVSSDGEPFLRMSPLQWEGGWPFVPTTEVSN